MCMDYGMLEHMINTCIYICTCNVNECNEECMSYIDEFPNLSIVTL